MPRLPQDVWQLIAQHLVEPELNKLLSMNQVLLDVVLDRRYRKVEWVMLDDRIVKYMMRLQDPYIAARVRCLHIRAWFIQFLFRSEDLFKETETSHLYGIRKHVAELFRRPPSQPMIKGAENIALTKRLGVLSSSKQILRAMVKAVNLMVNVTEYQFEWGDLTFNAATQSLLAATRRAFDTSLFKLVIHARVSQLKHFLCLANFHVLGELEFRFDSDPTSGDPSDTDIDAINEAVLIGSVAPFINHLRTSLRALTISSSANGDHAPFLNALGPLPKLGLLVLRISFARGHLSDGSPIGRLLHIHESTLTSVQVYPNPPPRIVRKDNEAYFPPYERPRDPDAVQAWAAATKQSLRDPSWLTSLESLGIPTINHSITLALIRHTPSTLTRLYLVDNYLKTTAVEEILSLLGPSLQLQYLSIAIINLDPELFRTLANILPSLYSLTLVLGVETYWLRPSDLIMQRYPLLMDWALVDLSIFFQHTRDNSVIVIPETRAENRIMFHLKDYILPKLKSFRGLGHMLVESTYTV